mmetsp:Transcript_84453/g.149428  ORF Transcript_84453/g.149428 Transcript_84453/m.149428 type:complete len:888 (+) Transcript_84453:78-2741(+)
MATAWVPLSDGNGNGLQRSVESDLEREWDECLEGMLSLRDAVQHDLTIVTMNLRRYAHFPRDLQVGSSTLYRLLGKPLPDVICVQEGLEGIDVLAEAGYKRIASSVLRAQALRDSAYGNAAELEAVSGALHGRLLVNELYMRMEGSSWEAIDSGAAQISSDLMLDLGGDDGLPSSGVSWPLATRSAVWTKLRHRERPAGPFAFVLNVQFSGNSMEDRFFAGPLAEERKLQAERLLDLFGSRIGVSSDDLGLLVGDFAAAAPEDSGSLPLRVPSDTSSFGFAPDELLARYQAYLAGPFSVLQQHGWKMAYSQAKVGPTSPNNQLVDYMATNRAAPVKSQVLFASGRVSRPTEAPLSDHNFVKASVRVRFPEVQPANHAVVSKAVRQRRMEAMARGLNSSPWLNNGAMAAAIKAGANRRMRLRCEHEDLAREHRCERAAAEELQEELSSEMRALRDQCQEQGQTVGMLTQRLADARGAVQAQLHGVATERAALGGELMSEESQRNALEAARLNEESEAACRVEAADQQLASMMAVRDSLQAQLRASLKVQDELRSHIGAERKGREELEVAGERELVAWHEHNSKETEQIGPLSEQLKGVREAQHKLRCYLKAEASLCQSEMLALRERTEETEEETQAYVDNARRCAAALGASACEQPHLQEEAAQAMEVANGHEQELESATRRTKDLEEQLRLLKEEVVQCRQDDLALRLREERDSIVEEVQQEACRKEDLMDELDQLRRSRGLFGCLFPAPPRSPHHSAPLPPPAAAPPRQPPPQRPAATYQPPLRHSDSDNSSGQDAARQPPPRQDFVTREIGDEGAGVGVDESGSEVDQVGSDAALAARLARQGGANSDEYLFDRDRQAGAALSMQQAGAARERPSEEQFIESDEV